MWLPRYYMKFASAMQICLHTFLCNYNGQLDASHDYTTYIVTECGAAGICEQVIYGPYHAVAKYKHVKLAFAALTFFYLIFCEY